jgi:hypothetical protein
MLEWKFHVYNNSQQIYMATILMVDWHATTTLAESYQYISEIIFSILQVYTEDQVAHL